MHPQEAESQGHRRTAPTRAQNIQKRVDKVKNDKTVLRGRLRVQRPKFRRFELKIQVAPSDNPMEEAHDTIVGIMRKLQATDKRLVIYPWYWKDATGAQPKMRTLVSPDSIPKTNDIKRYFPGLQIDKPSGGTFYTSVLLGMEKELEVIMEPSGSWLRNNGHGLFDQLTQSEQQFTVGWLLYSTRSMDTKRLQLALKQWCGFDVSARWQVINTGHNKDLKETDKIRAIHLRVDADIQEEALTLFGEIYSSTSKKHPLSHRMRLIPPIDRMMNPTNQDKFVELRNRQSRFNAAMIPIQTWEIEQLFVPGSSTKRPLHSFLMEIPSPSLRIPLCFTPWTNRRFEALASLSATPTTKHLPAPW
jgi:hypothetical protein